MADYTYNIFAAAGNAAPNFTTIAGAIADFVANAPARMGGAAATVPDAQTLSFSISGFLSLTNQIDDFTGITMAGTTSQIVVKPASNAWNANPSSPVSYDNTKDGVDYGANGALRVSGIPRVTIQDLMFHGSNTSNFQSVALTDTSGSSKIQRCIVYHDGAGGSALKVSGASAYNCAVIVNNATAINAIFSETNTATPKVEQCTVVNVNATVGGNAIFSNNAPAPVVKNTYCGGFTNLLNNTDAWGTGCTGNATDLASGGGGTGTNGFTYNVALSTTNFNSVSGSGADVKGKATLTSVSKLSAPSDVDCFNRARSATTTIGAFGVEITAGAPGAAALLYKRLTGANCNV